MGRRVSPAQRLALLLLALVAACDARPADDAGLTVSAAVVAEPVLGERTAMYVVITNRGARDDQLDSISTPAAERAEMHRTVDHGGMRTMEPLGSVLIPAGGSVSLEPGGHHVMLLNLTRTLAAGDSVRATLHFRRAGDVPVKARVVAYSELEESIGTAEPHGAGRH